MRNWLSCLAICACAAAFGGCSGESTADGLAGRPSHLVPDATGYYFQRPANTERKADGQFPAGMKIRMIEPGEPYSLVRSVQGVKAYVATEALQVKSDADDLEDD